MEIIATIAPRKKRGYEGIANALDRMKMFLLNRRVYINLSFITPL